MQDVHSGLSLIQALIFTLISAAIFCGVIHWDENRHGVAGPKSRARYYKENRQKRSWK